MSTPAPAGYSGAPLVRKLGIKPEARLGLIGAPEGFDDTLGELPPGVSVRRRLGAQPFDVIVAFHARRADLERRLPAVTAALDPAGGLWLAWPKRASGVATDVTEDVVVHSVSPPGWSTTRCARSTTSGRDFGSCIAGGTALARATADLSSGRDPNLYPPTSAARRGPQHGDRGRSARALERVQVTFPLEPDDSLHLLVARALVAPGPRLKIAEVLVLVGSSNSHLWTPRVIPRPAASPVDVITVQCPVISRAV